MRQIEPYWDDIPKSMKLSAYTDRLKEVINQRKQGQVVEIKDYAPIAVKNKLITIFKDKCAFCECDISTGHHYDTEHFRPKVTYYWLAYEWSNFVLACRKCNSDCKGTQFPTKKQAIALPHADIDDDLDAFLADCHILKLEDEDRLLLHPVLDDPAEHLDFQENGEVYAKNKSEKGQNSIEVYGLNDWQDSKKPKKKAKRKKLVLDRKRIVENVRESVKDAMNRYQINPNEAVLFYLIERKPPMPSGSGM